MPNPSDFLTVASIPPLPEVVLSLSPDYSRIDLYPESIKADEMRAVMHCRGTVKIIDESTIVCWRAGAK
ncbi:hypothetical protein [Burkholderia contaminans]|uniref:Uncharacterized protein n=1 Tax=Burkholderia contaminans TaxID=488447 RepID=A0A2S5DR48_9BURK|nr:hypothetical protein [Burkholderia contaminans]POZ81579.1 hypothetical protein C3743_14710 [Burkholderia contaminans]